MDLEMNGGAGGKLLIKRKGSCIKPAFEVDMRMTYLRRRYIYIYIEEPQNIGLEWKRSYFLENLNARLMNLDLRLESTGPRVNNTVMLFHVVVSSFISADHKNVLVEVWAVA